MISKSLLVISAFGLVFSCIFRFLIPNYRDKINENNQIISKSEYKKCKSIFERKIVVSKTKAEAILHQEFGDLLKQ
jgi:hypothetical protein